MEITIETTVDAPLDEVWSAWTTPGDVRNWNFASDDWCCPAAASDFTVGGRFNYRMEARDGSAGFDLEGTFTAIEDRARIEFALDDDRKVSVTFTDTGRGVRVSETFEAEDRHAAELQRQGWQAILDNFRKHVEDGRP